MDDDSSLSQNCHVIISDPPPSEKNVAVSPQIQLFISVTPFSRENQRVFLPSLRVAASMHCQSHTAHTLQEAQFHAYILFCAQSPDRSYFHSNHTIPVIAVARQWMRTIAMAVVASEGNCDTAQE
jgi:hypothetical protein